MKKIKNFQFLVLFISVLALTMSCGEAERKVERTPGLAADAQEIAEARGLSPRDVEAALKTYMPSGVHDDYLMFASGGHSGQVLVIGIPSMRLLKVIGVFTPEPWQGFGVGSAKSAKILREGQMPLGDERKLTWGDTHHPALSETGGEYDGQFLFINDKANARVGVIDLRDFATKQIVKTPNMISDHGAAFVTFNTEYVIQGSQYGAPIPFDRFVPIDRYKEEYRGLIAFHKFDRDKGRLVEEGTFQIELPPYGQDICDAGKLVSKSWVFCNSFNTEMATGGILEGNPPLEIGASQHDMDYMHVINWEKAAKVVEEGKYDVISGAKVISLQTAVEEGLLFFIPEPKSPHGVDVSPTGEFIVVSGKLDTHATVYSFEKIMNAIENKNYEYADYYGVPVLSFADTVEAQIDIGLGPLHTQFDDRGYAYTSVFIESMLAKWKMGGPYASGSDSEPWTLVEKIPVHYNIGHVACAEGDTVEPHGKYCVALNKWALDRYTPVGPLHPQSFQLIDITGERMQLLYDMPIGVGEPHYAQIIKTDKLNPWLVYPEMGFNSLKMAKDPNAPMPGEERIVRNGDTVDVYMTAIRSHFNPDHIHVKQGDRVRIHITSIERAQDAIHGFTIDGYNISISLEPGEYIKIEEFVADKPGVYPFYCTEFCSALHLEMAGYFFVEPR